MINTTLVKRRALYPREVGFFPSTPMAEQDISTVAMDSEVICSFYSPRNLEALKFLWALVHKTAENSDRWLDKDEAMTDLKLRAGFAKMVFNNKTRELELRPKSLKRISDEEMRSLTNKVIEIICAEVLPGMRNNDLRKEIEEMCQLSSKQRGV